MPNIANNRFGLFAAPKPSALRNTPSNETMAELDQFIEAHRQQLLKDADVLIRAKLLHSFHRVRSSNTEDYLRSFIHDFEKEPALSEVIALYREKLSEYEHAKTLAIKDSKDSLVASKQITEAPKLTPQELDWQQLLETLKRCVNNRATRNTLSWHPHHNENYYLAKFRVQWERYEANYGSVVLNNFAQSLAHEIAEGRRQTVVEKHVEAMQSLMQQKMDFTPTRLANKEATLEQEKMLDLEEINMLVPQFIEYADEIIAFAQQTPSREVQGVFSEAILEIQRQERAIANNPTLFNLAIGKHHKNHALATLDKIDELNAMKTFHEIFTAESATISAEIKDDSIPN